MFYHIIADYEVERDTVFLFSKVYSQIIAIVKKLRNK